MKHIQPKYLRDITVEGVDPRDYPDFVDALAGYAWHTVLNRELNDQELDYLTSNYPEVIHELAMESIF